MSVLLKYARRVVGHVHACEHLICAVIKLSRLIKIVALKRAVFSPSTMPVSCVDETCSLRTGILGDRLRALADGVLGKFTR